MDLTDFIWKWFPCYRNYNELLSSFPKLLSAYLSQASLDKYSQGLASLTLTYEAGSVEKQVFLQPSFELLYFHDVICQYQSQLGELSFEESKHGRIKDMLNWLTAHLEFLQWATKDSSSLCLMESTADSLGLYRQQHDVDAVVEFRNEFFEALRSHVIVSSLSSRLILNILYWLIEFHADANNEVIMVALLEAYLTKESKANETSHPTDALYSIRRCIAPEISYLGAWIYSGEVKIDHRIEDTFLTLFPQFSELLQPA